LAARPIANSAELAYDDARNAMVLSQAANLAISRCSGTADGPSSSSGTASATDNGIGDIQPRAHPIGRGTQSGAQG
jgi:hypothetical protein